MRGVSEKVQDSAVGVVHKYEFHTYQTGNVAKIVQAYRLSR